MGRILEFGQGGGRGIRHAAGVMLVAVMLLFQAVGIRAEENKEQARLQVIQSLNQIAVSLTHIITYNDKVVLDQEYNTIINNLNLSKIPDADIITLLQELMDLLVSSKIQGREKEILAQTYERNVQKEIKQSIKTRLSDALLTLNPYTTLSRAVLSAGSFYFNYRLQINEYREAKEKGTWEIEKKTLQGLNDFYKKLLKHSWELMRRYNFPDEWRLNEKQLSDYTEILKEKDPTLRYRKLERIEAGFQKFPPYWYYRGQTAQAIGKKEDASRCYDTFRQINQGILRKDPFVVSVAMSEILLEGDDIPQERLKSDLSLILANSEDADWANIFFAAVQYARMGEMRTAGRLIVRNLDNGYASFMDSPDLVKSVGPLFLVNADADVFDRIMETVLKNDAVKNYDVLWLYGNMQNRDILKKLQPEFDRIMLLPTDKSFFNPLNLFKNDNISLFLPTRWIADNVSVSLRMSYQTRVQEFKKPEIAVLPEFPEIAIITFRDVLPIKEFIKKKQWAGITVSLDRGKSPEDAEADYHLQLFFTSGIIRAVDQAARVRKYSNNLYNPKADSNQMLSSDKDAGEKGKADRQAIWFNKEKIVLGDETFGWSDGGIE